jgi:hypothetical protein
MFNGMQIPDNLSYAEEVIVPVHGVHAF